MWRLVTTDFPPQDGGVATWSEGVARALGEAGEAVTVHARAAAGVRASRPTPLAPYEVAPMWGRSWASWQAVWAAASVLPRLRRGDRLVCATWPLAVRLLAPARRLGVPVAVAFHGSDLTRPPVVPGLDAVLREASVLLPVSRYLGGRLGQPYTVLPPPIDPQPPAAPGDALLVVARLTPYKGVDRAIRLASRLGRPITVVGDGPERPALEALAAELGVAATFTGRLAREDIPWDGAWACALLSRTDPDGSGAEGLGLVLVEAAARGIPTIGSEVGGIPEVADVVLRGEGRPDEDAPLANLPSREATRARMAAKAGRTRVVATLWTAMGGSRPPDGR